jgi:hypothetical protein
MYNCLMTIQLIGRLDHSEKEIDLAGYPTAWQAFAEAINKGENKFNLLVPSDISPTPYEAFIPELQIVHKGDKIVVQYEQGILSFSGSSEMLEKLAKNALWLAKHPQKSGNIQHHLHFEYYPNHPVIDKKSLSVVMSVVDPKER